MYIMFYHYQENGHDTLYTFLIFNIKVCFFILIINAIFFYLKKILKHFMYIKIKNK